MSQQPLDSIPLKSTGDDFFAAELNAVNDAVNINSDDVESRLASIDNAALDDTLTFLESLPVAILSYSTSELPSQVDNGTIVFNTSIMALVYFSDGTWYAVSDNSYMLTDQFRFKVNTENPGTPNNTFSMLDSLRSASVYNFTIEWGDGTIDTITSGTDPNLSHEYSTPGIYEIAINGIYNGFNYEDGPLDRLKLVEITNWGTFSITGDGRGTFYRCENLQITANDGPDFSNMTSAFWLFAYCHSTAKVPYFDTSNLTSWFGTFQRCYDLVSIPDYDYSSAANDIEGLRATFQHNHLMTAIPTGITEVTGIRGFRSTFQQCWLITSVPEIDFSSATRIDNIFRDCQSLTDFSFVPDFSSITNVDGSWAGCSLTAESIENILQGLYNSGKENLITSFTSGANGNNAPISTWTSHAINLYNTLTLDRGWTIAVDP